MAMNVVFEIGTEELPAGYIPGLLTQLRESAKEKLEAHRLAFGGVHTHATPRRLALLIDNVAPRSSDFAERHKGPSAAVAFDAEGQPTKAAVGFAKGKGIEADDLVTEDGYVYAETLTKGVPAEAVMETVLNAVIRELSFPKSMRWGDNDERFARPVRWLLALFDETVIPVSFAGVRSGNVTRGHRFLSEGDVVVPRAEVYVSTLMKAFVMVNRDDRKSLIVKQLEDAAAAERAEILYDESLLEEIVDLVEYPTVLCGSFESSYLSLPDAAVITPMKDHQRYFPLRAADGTLLPKFLTVRNGDDYALDTVRAGNERVLRARLDDAKFFFNEDRKKSLAECTEGLARIVFQEGLGHLGDKTERLRALGETFAEAFGLNEEECVALERATVLAKADLTTGLVTEFTELQGIIGKEYALLDGESPEVAEAIFEQYLPRFAGDVLPATNAGRVLSILDKVDTITATFSRGLVPTGSQDPYALRRQAIGILQMMGESGRALPLAPVFEEAARLLGVKEDTIPALTEQLEAFFTQRLKYMFRDRGYAHDVIEWVLSDSSKSVAEAEGLADALTARRIYEDEAVMQAFMRTYNLVKGTAYEGVDESLLSDDSERTLFAAALAAYEAGAAAYEAEDYATVVALPETLTEAIDGFFAGVMVMVDDERVKHNRLQLLRLAYEAVARIGDIGVLK